MLRADGFDDRNDERSSNTSNAPLSIPAFPPVGNPEPFSLRSSAVGSRWARTLIFHPLHPTFRNMSTSTQKPILLSGAGLSSLLLARAPLSPSIPFEIYERDTFFDERGQGYRLRLSAEGIDAV